MERKGRTDDMQCWMDRLDKLRELEWMERKGRTDDMQCWMDRMDRLRELERG
jgi:hypothetical protein